MVDKKNAQLICIGNAMVDVFAEVPADFCKRFALTLPVLHVDHKTAAAILEALPPGKIITAGGGAANTAKIASCLGIPTAFVGAAGSDSFGDLFEEELRQAGVYLHIVRKKSPTGVFLSLTSIHPLGVGKSAESKDEGFSKHIVASPSAALELDADDIDETMFANPTCSAFQENRPRMLFVEGFLLERERLINRIMELAVKYNLALAIDPGTATIAAEQAKLIQQGNSPFWDSCLKNPLILFFNEKEAEAFAGIFNTDWENHFFELSRKPYFQAAVKLAERGAVVFSGGKVYRETTKAVEAAESTGAGDAFAGGFLAAWLNGEGPQQCGRKGNAAAAMVLKAPGTQVIS